MTWIEDPSNADPRFSRNYLRHRVLPVLTERWPQATASLARTAERVLAAGAASVDVAVTHALFAGDALALIRAAGVGEVWSTDCIVHPSNAVQVAPMLAEALRSLMPA